MTLFTDDYVRQATDANPTYKSNSLCLNLNNKFIPFYPHAYFNFQFQISWLSNHITFLDQITLNLQLSLNH